MIDIFSNRLRIRARQARPDPDPAKYLEQFRPFHLSAGKTVVYIALQMFGKGQQLRELVYPGLVFGEKLRYLAQSHAFYLRRMLVYYPQPHLHPFFGGIPLSTLPLKTISPAVTV
jgi:hypothetical protein